MYDSRPRPVEGEPIEEVLPAAINATATSARGESQRDCRGGELARKQTRRARIAGEPEMRVMHAGSVALNFGGLSGSHLMAAAVVVLALIVLAVILL